MSAILGKLGIGCVLAVNFALVIGCGETSNSQAYATNPPTSNDRSERGNAADAERAKTAEAERVKAVDAERAKTADAPVPRKVDNSGQNAADTPGTTMTPFDQGTSQTDMTITQTIRKELTGDSSLSINAQNLKVITANGVVVLRGPVASQTESDAVLDHVRKVNGIVKVDNQIAVP